MTSSNPHRPSGDRVGLVLRDSFHVGLQGSVGRVDEATAGRNRRIVADPKVANLRDPIRGRREAPPSCIPGRKFPRRLSDDQRARRLEPRNDRRISLRHEVLEASEPVSRRQIHRIDLIFHQGRHAVQSSDWTAYLERGVQSIGLLLCARVDVCTAFSAGPVLSYARMRAR